jgi:outer membrane protein assembly factor BamB
MIKSKLVFTTNFIYFILFSALISQLSWSQTPFGQWAMLKNQENRNGRAYFKGPERANLLWMTRVNSLGIQSGIVIGLDGVIYGGSDDGYIHAFNADGSIRWSTWLDDTRITACPAIGMGRCIYAVTEGGSSGGKLHALSPKGAVKWSFALNDYAGPSASPAVADDGTILVCTRSIYAINPDGTKKWRVRLNDFINGPCAISAQGTIYFPCGNILYALNPDGTLKWQLSIPGSYGLGGAPAVDDNGVVYINTYLGQLNAVDPGGSLKWSFQSEGIVTDVPSSPAIGYDGTIYYGGGGEYGGRGGYLYALNPEGQLLWKFFAGHEITAPAVAKNGIIYFANGSGGKLFAVAADGILKWSYGYSYQYARTEPAIGYKGRLYIGLLGYMIKGGVAAFAP